MSHDSKLFVNSLMNSQFQKMSMLRLDGQCFFFLISEVGDHPQEDFAKFGFLSKRKVEKCRNPCYASWAVFFFLICEVSGLVGDHPQEDLAKFGYLSKTKVEKFRNPSLFLMGSVFFPNL
jgi:hypothetical protein